MEQKEKIEKPEWVQIVESLPEIVRQPVGNTCVGILTSLIQIYLMRADLYDAVRNEADHLIGVYYAEMETRNNSPE